MTDQELRDLKVGQIVVYRYGINHMVVQVTANNTSDSINGTMYQITDSVVLYTTFAVPTMGGQWRIYHHVHAPNLELVE